MTRARRARGGAPRGRRPARRRARRRRRPPAPSWATAAAAGPRAAGREADYALLVEAIVEGYLQHYGTGRVVRPDDPDLALLAGDRLYALGLARLAELGDLAAVAELADVISLAAQAHAEGDPERAARVWQAGAAAVGHGTRRRSSTPRRPPRAPASPTPPPRCAPRCPHADRTARPGAKVRPGSARRVDIVQRPPMADGRKEPKSKYTLDRGMPGAFEGETVTRRRLMTLTAHGAGVAAVAAFALPALGFAAGSALFDRPPATWRPVGPPEDFPPDTYVPRVITAQHGIGQVGKTTVYVRARNAGHRRAAEPARDRRASFIALSTRCMHLGCPVRYIQAAQRFVCPCHGGVYDFRGKVAGGPPVRPLDRFYTRVRNGQVEIGPRYSVNSEFRRFPSYRDPGQDLDGIGQYLYPGRFSTPEEGLAAHEAPASTRSHRPPAQAQAARRGRARQAARPGQGGGHRHRRLGRRAHVAVGRGPLGDVPQGPQGHELVLHARLGDAVRLPLAGRDGRVPGDVLRPVDHARLRVRRATSPTRSSSASSCAACTSWGSTVMVILVFLHMARTFFFGAYKYPRELNWLIGVVLLILTMTMSFTGYLLPFDQRSYWATIVGVNINGTGPLVGPFLSDFLRGGAEFGSTTLSRFYAIHMLLVPGGIAAMIGAHLYLVTRLGTTAPPWLRAEAGRRGTRSRHEPAREGALPPRVLAAEGAGEAVLPLRGGEGLADGVRRPARRSS